MHTVLFAFGKYDFLWIFWQVLAVFFIVAVGLLGVALQN
ncbi:Hypothetical protein CulFRC58_1120 [Corynebacterium ulcerans FRC58]|uniref:Uncharacterized protein n=1 Tax=Corynebacterium ulcerans FRC58 TaxID=1408268 RepID=A0ABN4GXF5_CORUL|nr:Hypothetical protein CulFRC58_1120 [Corynebacterium ulcerans FRC58]